MIKYLTFPALSVNANELQANLISVSYQAKVEGFTSYKIKDDYSLTKEVKALIPEQFRHHIKVVALQNIDSRWNNYIHKDIRKYGLSCILQQGGPSVTTSFYNDNIELIHSEVIPLHKWHYFNAQVYHAVNNIVDKRIGISVSLDTPSEEFFQWLESVNV